MYIENQNSNTNTSLGENRLAVVSPTRPAYEVFQTKVQVPEEALARAGESLEAIAAQANQDTEATECTCGSGPISYHEWAYPLPEFQPGSIQPPTSPEEVARVQAGLDHYTAGSCTAPVTDEAPTREQIDEALPLQAVQDGERNPYATADFFELPDLIEHDRLVDESIQMHFSLHHLEDARTVVRALRAGKGLCTAPDWIKKEAEALKEYGHDWYEQIYCYQLEHGGDYPAADPGPQDK